MITREFDLFLTAGGETPVVVNANQYDQNEQWIFTLYETSGLKYTPSSGSIVGIKADGKAIANTGTVNSDGQVVITETEQMTAVAGKALYELQIDNRTHGTANFIVLVKQSPSDKGVFSNSDLSLFREALDSVNPNVIAKSVEDWMDENLTPTTPVVDKTLTVDGAAADAKKVGDELTDIDNRLDSIVNDISNIFITSDKISEVLTG